jgi:hypothetical protein
LHCPGPFSTSLACLGCCLALFPLRFVRRALDSCRLCTHVGVANAGGPVAPVTRSLSPSHVHPRTRSGPTCGSGGRPRDAVATGYNALQHCAARCSRYRFAGARPRAAPAWPTLRARAVSSEGNEPESSPVVVGVCSARTPSSFLHTRRSRRTFTGAKSAALPVPAQPRQRSLAQRIRLALSIPTDVVVLPWRCCAIGLRPLLGGSREDSSACVALPRVPLGATPLGQPPSGLPVLPA